MKFTFFSDLKNKLLTHPLLSRLEKWAKTRTLPGFEGHAIYDIIYFIYLEAQKDKLVTRANSISFSFFLSLFPSIIAFFTLIPILLPYIFNAYIVDRLPDDSTFIYGEDGEIDFVETLLYQLDGILPNVMGRVEVMDMIRDIVSQPRAGLLSFGFLLATFFASNGVMSMMRGFEKSYPKTFRTRNNLNRRLTSLGLLSLFTLMVLSSILLIIAGNQMINYWFEGSEAQGFLKFSIKLVRYIILTALVYFGISFIYRFGVPTHVKIKVFSIGTTVATVASILSTTLFGLYVDNFGTFNKLYGSIGTIIVIMIWIQVNIFVLLVGYELNASIAIHRDLKKVNKVKDAVVKKEG